MKRLTTDTPKDNLETALNLFYIKDYETWVRGYGPAPEYADVSLFDLTRDIVKTHIPEAELPADDDAVSNMMPEWLMDGIDSAEGIVALLYTAAWAYAELRHKLMRYENAGMEPEEIERIVDAYGRGHTLRTESAERLEIVRGIKTDCLRELAQANQDGRLLVLPCKVGDTVYAAETSPVIPLPVAYVGVYLEGADGGDWEALENIGKTVFLTREEAEAALAGKGGDFRLVFPHGVTCMNCGFHKATIRGWNRRAGEGSADD